MWFLVFLSHPGHPCFFLIILGFIGNAACCLFELASNSAFALILLLNMMEYSFLKIFFTCLYLNCLSFRTLPRKAIWSLTFFCLWVTWKTSRTPEKYLKYGEHAHRFNHLPTSIKDRDFCGRGHCLLSLPMCPHSFPPALSLLPFNSLSPSFYPKSLGLKLNQDTSSSLYFPK